VPQGGRQPINAKAGLGLGFETLLFRVGYLNQLLLAKLTPGPHFAASLMDKAVHLKSQVEEAPPAADASLCAPDIEREK
jgi:hypothetical protein